MMRSAFFIVAVALLFSLPGLAEACSVCGFGREENRGAFLVTTVVLSVLPVGTIGAVVFYIWRQARRREPASPVPAASTRAASPSAV